MEDLVSVGHRRSRSVGSGSGESDAAQRAKVRKIEETTAETERVVDSLSAVNGGIIRALRQKIDGILGSRQDWQDKTADLQQRLLCSDAGRADAELRRLDATTALEYQKSAVTALQRGLETIGPEAAAAVSSRTAASTKAQLAAVETRVAAEAALSDDLVEHVHSFFCQSLSLLEQHTSQSLEADLQATGKDVVIARLQTALSVELARHARYYDEVDALMRIVAILAQRSKTVDTTSEELARAKGHVRLLERHLDLNGIVAAVTPPAGIPNKSRRLPPMPSADLQARTPHFFALRMLQHHDMTLSELVDAWQRQEQRLDESQDRYQELRGSVDSVRHDAMLARQQYLEERQRREICDRRITEMIRERARGSGAGAVVEELNQLRWNYSQVVDDAAQLAVALKLAREEAVAGQEKTRDLQQRVRQLERDAQTDQVAATLSELRAHYERGIASLRHDYTEAELQRLVLLTTIDQHREADAVTREALALSRDNAATMTCEVRATIANMNAALAALQGKIDDRDSRAGEVQRLLGEKVAEMRAALDDLQAQTEQFNRDQQAEVGRYGAQVAGLLSCAAAGAEKLSSAGAARQSSEGGPSSAATDSTVAALIAGEKAAAMRTVVNDAMIFVAQQLESADAQQTSLVDASISDAQYVSFLTEKLHQVSGQRDSLAERLTSAQAVISQNHLRLVEQALMHEVSVEDSLGIAEAGERIAALQEQLGVSLAVRQSALDEVTQYAERQQQLEADVERLARTNAQLVARRDQAEKALHDSQLKERGVLASKVEMQSQVRAALADGCAADVPGHEHLAASNEKLEAMLRQFDTQLSRMIEAIHDASARGQTPSAGFDVESLQQDGDSATSEKAVGEYLARTGLNGVVKLVSQTLKKAELLKHALADSAQASSMALASAASGEVALLTPEMQLAAEQHRGRELAGAVSTLKAEKHAMEQKLSETEKATETGAAANRRLLGLTKTLLSVKEAHETEIRALRARVAELAPPVAAAPPAVDGTDVAPPETPPVTPGTTPAEPAIGGATAVPVDTPLLSAAAEPSLPAPSHQDAVVAAAPAAQEPGTVDDQISPSTEQEQ